MPRLNRTEVTLGLAPSLCSPISVHFDSYSHSSRFAYLPCSRCVTDRTYIPRVHPSVHSRSCNRPLLTEASGCALFRLLWIHLLTAHPSPRFVHILASPLWLLTRSSHSLACSCIHERRYAALQKRQSDAPALMRVDVVHFAAGMNGKPQPKEE